MSTAYDKYLSALQESSNNAANLQNLVNEEYEEKRAGYEAKAKIGEDVLEGVIGFEAIGGLKNLYTKTKERFGRRRQNQNENENQNQAQAQEDDAQPDAPAPANEDEAIDDGMEDVGDDFEFVQPADFDDMLTDQAQEMLGQGNDLVGDDMEGMTEMTDLGEGFQPASGISRPVGTAQQQTMDFDPEDVGGLTDAQSQALDDFGGADADLAEAGEGVGGVVVPEGAYGQIQDARDAMARVLRGEEVEPESGPVADVTPDIFDADFDPDWVQTLPAGADLDDPDILGEGADIPPSQPQEMPNLDDYVAQDIDTSEPATTATEPADAPDVAPTPDVAGDVAPEDVADVGEGAGAGAGEDLAVAGGEVLGEEIGEDLTVGAVLGPIGEAGAVVYGIYQTIEALLGMGGVKKSDLPTQAGISMTPEGNTPTTMNL